jgi:hypothetical protein
MTRSVYTSGATIAVDWVKTPSDETSLATDLGHVVTDMMSGEV